VTIKSARKTHDSPTRSYSVDVRRDDFAMSLTVRRYFRIAYTYAVNVRCRST